jgi:hypothetical protein
MKYLKLHNILNGKQLFGEIALHLKQVLNFAWITAVHQNTPWGITAIVFQNSVIISFTRICYDKIVINTEKCIFTSIRYRKRALKYSFHNKMQQKPQENFTDIIHSTMEFGMTEIMINEAYSVHNPNELPCS